MFYLTEADETMQALRLVLGDNDTRNRLYLDSTLSLALFENRRTVQYRNPYTLATGQYYTLGYPAPIRVPVSNWEDSLLQNEPGERSFQAAVNLRHWDSTSAVVIYASGVLKDASFYTIDYPTGRVTFDVDMGDWQPVNASFSYFRLYYAARQILLQDIATGGAKRLLKVKTGGVEEEYMSPEVALRAIDRMIGTFTPSHIRRAQKIY